MKLKRLFAKPAIGFAIVAASVVAACSGGGGGSSPAPVVSPVLAGIGPDIPFDQKVNFTVIVPPPATTTAVAAARRKRRAASAANTNPYVSPNVASITLQVGTVNGQSPRLLPPLQTFAVSCSGTGGCAVPIQNIPAAKGVDRFAVQTFSGPGAIGNIISSGFIDVTVPSAQAISFGGTSLTIGGFVASLSVALSIPGGTFFYGTPATGMLDVNAIDPAGAIIIGSDLLASPISVSFTNANAEVGTNGNNGAFALNSLQQVALQQPAQPITLAYSGQILLGEKINVATSDENSQPISTSIPIPIKATPAPATPVPATPTPVPIQKAPLSLYVYDGTGDRILEYAGINAFEGGQPFSMTARRIFEITAPDSLIPTLNGCASASSISSIIYGFAVSSTGTIFAQTNCTDLATQTKAYIFTYSAATQEAVIPQILPTPPAPSSIFTVTVGTVGGTAGSPQGIKLDEPHGLLDVAYIDSNFLASEFISVASFGSGNITSDVGAACIQEIGFSIPCQTNTNYSYYPMLSNFAIDANGYTLAPTYYQNASDANGNPIVPPGDPTQAFISEPTVVYIAPGNNAAPSPVSALAGIQDELGDAVDKTQYVAVEGSTLYTLQSPTSVTTASQTFWPGLSGCPLPSANAVPDTAASSCANGSGAPYLAAFPNAPQTLAAANNAGKNVVVAPNLMVGGDSVGNFSSIPSAVGDALAVRDGYAYVINPQPSGGGPPEIDVYNLNNVMGYHTDIAPSAKLILDPLISPTSIAIGPTGTGIGGQAILRRPARVHHDVKAWYREIQRRRALHQIRRASR